jgi:hypothetical protein
MDRPSPHDPAGQYNTLADCEGWHSICFADLNFASAKLNALLAIWRGLADENQIPKRKDLTPQRLRAYLSDIAIYERVTELDGRERWRARVMGAKFSSVMGNYNGKFFDEVIPAKFLKRWYAAPNATLAARVPLRFVSRSETADKGFITGEYLMAPLIGDDGGLNTVLSAGEFGPTFR